MTDVYIRTDDIQLDQLLKLAGAVSTGGEVKALVEKEDIAVNGKVETARRRKLHPGDRVTLTTSKGDAVYQVVRKE